jgi:hypothetical protein
VVIALCGLLLGAARGDSAVLRPVITTALVAADGELLGVTEGTRTLGFIAPKVQVDWGCDGEPRRMLEVKTGAGTKKIEPTADRNWSHFSLEIWSIEAPCAPPCKRVKRR